MKTNGNKNVEDRYIACRNGKAVRRDINGTVIRGYMGEDKSPVTYFCDSTGGLC